MRITLFIIIVTACHTSFGQNYFNKRIEYSFNGTFDWCKSIVAVDDGYIIGGGTGTEDLNFWPRIGFYKISENGEKIFSKIYGDTTKRWWLGNSGSLKKLNQNMYLATGSTKTIFQDNERNDGYLLFLNNEFDTLFTRVYKEKVDPHDTSYIFTQSVIDNYNNIISTGSKYPHNFWEQAILLKFDNSGNFIWEKTFGATGFMFSGESVIHTSDGGYCIGGKKWSPMGPVNYTGEPVVIKTDSAGNQQWMKTFGGPWDETIAMVCNVQDGNFVVATTYCDSMQGGYHPFRRINLIKLNNNGTILWDKKYCESAGERTVLNVRENPDHSLVTSGVTLRLLTYSYQHIGFILKTDVNGDSIWYREYLISNGDYSQHQLYDIIETPDKGYLACGWVHPTSPDTGSMDGWLLKVDSLGCETPSYCWVSVQEEKQLPAREQMEIYPNPAGCWATFGFESVKTGLIRLSLYDLFGRTVREVTLPPGQTRIRLDVADLPAGMYIACAMAGNRIIGREKLIVSSENK